jgi:glutamate 5-kinase
MIAEFQYRGKEVILVSSGAVAAGRSRVNEGKTFSRSIPEKQALAAVGQTHLMATWSRFFDKPCAQILLTYDDLRNRRRFVNAKNTIVELLRLRTLPIINENDSVSVDELKLGDNDNLAAHVAVLTEADLLLILSDIDGLFDANPRTHPQAKLIREVHGIDAAIHALADGSHHPIGTGGMVTKLEAAEKASVRGITTLIVNGVDDQALAAVLDGRCPGTRFHPTANPIAARKHWLRHALPVMGRLTVDAGAAGALLEGGASLLPSVIVAVSGNFHHGDAVEVFHDGRKLARGMVLYGSAHLDRIKGRKSAEIADILGFSYSDVIIHRSDMIIEPQNGRSENEAQSEPLATS